VWYGTGCSVLFSQKPNNILVMINQALVSCFGPLSSQHQTEAFPPDRQLVLFHELLGSYERMEVKHPSWYEPFLEGSRPIQINHGVSVESDAERSFVDECWREILSKSISLHRQRALVSV
jgi:hypothetical protein